MLSIGSMRMINEQILLLIGRGRLGGMLRLGMPKTVTFYGNKKSLISIQWDCSVHHTYLLPFYNLPIGIGDSADAPLSSYLH